MPLRLVPWSPEYGSGIEAEPDTPDDGATPEVDIHVEERPWQVVRPGGDPPAAVQIIDGVRRVEAHAIDDTSDGGIAFGLFGSYAVGVVRCEGARARILDGEGELRVERVYLQGGGEPQDHEITAGGVRLLFRASLQARARTANKLVNALQDAMLGAEVVLAETLAADEGLLTVVDGPLRLRSVRRRVVGYVKRVQDWYIEPAERALLSELAVGDRTPLFRIPGGGEAGRRGRPDRYAWYLRIGDVGEQYHQLAGIVRLEAPGALPVPDAARLADECGRSLPRLASSPVRDPRAPQNLTPVGALEDVLRRRLGERDWVRRLIAVALRAGPLPAATTEGGARW